MKTFNKVLIFIAGITLVRLIVIAKIGLHPDEAYYWLWSRHLDLCYYDHPPMFAYFLRLAGLLGDHPFFVRLPAIVSGVIISLVVYKILHILFPSSSKIPFWGVVLLNILPLISAGIVMTPDVPLLLFWALSMWAMAILFVDSSPTVKSGNTLGSHPNYLKMWLLAGLLFGLGMLSKYTFVLLSMCVFFYLLISNRNRWFLKTLYPYLALIVGVLVFSPVIFWNARHNWVSFAFQLKHGVGGSGIKFDNFLNYLGSQLAVGGVLPTIIAVIGSILYLFSKNNESKKFLASFTLPILVFFGITSFKNPQEANWTAPAYIGLAMITAVMMFGEDKIGRVDFLIIMKKILSTLTIIIPLFVTIFLYLQAAFRVIPLEKVNPLWHLMEPTNRFYGWQEFTQHLIEISDGKPVIAPDHQSASLILYYSRYKPLEVRAGTNNFIFYENFTRPVKGGCFTFDYVTDVKTGPVDFALFSNVKESGSFDALRDGVPIRFYHIYECQDFSGFRR